MVARIRSNSGTVLLQADERRAVSSQIFTRVHYIQKLGLFLHDSNSGSFLHHPSGNAHRPLRSGDLAPAASVPGAEDGDLRTTPRLDRPTSKPSTRRVLAR